MQKDTGGDLGCRGRTEGGHGAAVETQKGSHRNPKKARGGPKDPREEMRRG